MVTISLFFGELDEEDTELDPRDLEEDDLDRLLNTLDIVGTVQRTRPTTYGGTFSFPCCAPSVLTDRQY